MCTCLDTCLDAVYVLGLVFGHLLFESHVSGAGVWCPGDTDKSSPALSIEGHSDVRAAEISLHRSRTFEPETRSKSNLAYRAQVLMMRVKAHILPDGFKS